MNKLLEVKNLNLSLKKDKKKILNNINFTIEKKEILGIVGESGAGKSSLINAITALIDENKFSISGELVYFGRTSLLTMSEKERRNFCSKHTTIIPQDSINSLNPYERIEKQLFETYKLHNKCVKEKNKIKENIENILKEIGFSDIDRILKSYPNELSGGMKQRLVIALSLCGNISLLLADEPTTSLDAINQYKFVEFLQKICVEKDLTLIYISHDIKLLAQLCHRIVVMKNGEIVEAASKSEIFNNPQNKYTKLLLSSMEM